LENEINILEREYYHRNDLKPMRNKNPLDEEEYYISYYV